MLGISTSQSPPGHLCKKNRQKQKNNAVRSPSLRRRSGAKTKLKNNPQHWTLLSKPRQRRWLSGRHTCSQNCHCHPSRFASRNWKIGRNRAKFRASRACCRLIGGATARSPGGIYMTTVVLNRRNLLAAGGSVLATGVSGLLLPARAKASHRPLRCRAGPTTTARARRSWIGSARVASG